MHANRSSSIDELFPSFQEGCKETSASDGGETLVHLYERMARAQPDKTAVVLEAGMGRLSYGELNERANRLARYLREKMVGSPSGERFVGIFLDRSPEILIAMLGILKAGCAYLPIDSSYPGARVMAMLEDARPVMLLTTTRLARVVADVLQPSLLIGKIDELSAELAAQSGQDLQAPVTADGLAYLMYTSGSTGRPKGVMVTHRNVVRLLEQTHPWFHFSPEDVWTQFHSIAFDFSVWEIWGCLLTGGRLVLVSYETSRSPRDFHYLLLAESVTVLNQTPSAFLMLLGVQEGSADKLHALRFVIFGGEALQYRSLAPWFRRYGSTSPQVVNMYGITETTVHVTYRLVTATDAETTQESLIGVPIPDMQVYLLDESGKPVRDGVIGELYVGGAGVSRGYLNRPDLNETRFIADSFSGEPGRRLYRTGDVVRIRADGEMVYLGRNDRQVKINGFRIELGEVEAAIAECPGVRQACVIAQADGDGSQRLAAYFVTTAASPSAGTLSHFLAARLPAHMRPSFYMGLEKLPLTSNGKIDVASLPKPGAGRSGQFKIAQGSPISNEMEDQITKVWCKTLGVASTVLDDNFFDIGGTSLQLIRAHDTLELALGRRFSITWMFEYPTVRSLAKRLSDAPAASAKNRFQEQARRQRGALARASSAKRGVL